MLRGFNVAMNERPHKSAWHIRLIEMLDVTIASNITAATTPLCGSTDWELRRIISAPPAHSS